MNQITLNFSIKTALFHFLEYLAHGQEQIADNAETGLKDSKTLFSIMSLAKVQKQAAIDLVEMENESRMTNLIQVKLKFANKTELFHFLENIANAQEILADIAESHGKDPKTLFTIMALANIQKQAALQLAESAKGSGYNLPGKNPDFFIPMSEVN